jgi:hypothetical protein
MAAWWYLLPEQGGALDTTKKYHRMPPAVEGPSRFKKEENPRKTLI